MLPVGNMETEIFMQHLFIPMCAMYSYMQEHSVHLLIQLLYWWVRCIFMQEHSEHLLIPTSIPLGAMYLHAIMFCTLSQTSSIPLGAMYLHARMFCTLTHTSMPLFLFIL